MTEWKELLTQVGTKGDTATILIAGTVGYLLDAGLNIIGFLEPGIVCVLSSSSALGVKKLIEAILEQRRIKKNKQQLLEERKEKTLKLMNLLEKEGQADLVVRLKRAVNLIEAGVVEQEIFSIVFDEVIRGYLSKPSNGES